MPPAPRSALSTDALLSRLELLGTKLGLDTTRRLLAEAGHPEERFRVVLVAGSNGKGSTSALLASMAAAAGYRTGLYTSPHLEQVTERVRVDGLAVSDDELGAAVGETVAASERTDGRLPTYFEALTVAALRIFARRGVELAVLEVGMGGRLDATNATEPILSLISDVSLEHREHLGSTLSMIAREKAGILRADRPAVVWVEEAEAEAAIRGEAVRLGALFTPGPARCQVGEVVDHGFHGQTVELTTPAGRHRLELRLPGAHQVRNLALAVLGAEVLRERGWRRLDAAAMAAGAAGCRWPARLERVEPASAPPVVLDAAHNPSGAAALARFLGRRGERFRLLFGCLADKEVEGMLPPLAAAAEEVFLSRPRSPRARPPAELLTHVRGGAAVVEEEPGRALERALAGKLPLVVCGSIYLVGEVRVLLRERFGVPLAATAPLHPAAGELGRLSPR